ncbi:hypothetical protein [Roseobacter sp. HKCCA0434]|uniref:hypothetical protein n=1 Tax=Roseobacter sp. HKCCA0434 TaxID=3079297 RepID=UPI0029058E85|nr:hypothetical protein [Roseobacter sp. HKCCA0434]
MTDIRYVAAAPAHLDGMCAMLQRLRDDGVRTRPADPAFVNDNYIANPDRIACTVALDGAGQVLGFQSLSRARAGNPWDTPVG